MGKCNFKNKIFGIKKHLIVFLTLILGTIFLIALFCVNKRVVDVSYDFLEEQYNFVNDNVYEKFKIQYYIVDQLTENFITDEYVQKSLRNKGLNENDTENMKKMISYYNDTFLDAYMIVDNKGNLFSSRKYTVSYDDISKSELYKALGDDYSRTKLVYTKDNIFGSEKDSLFVVRKIHEMNTSHEPGMLILKLSDEFLEPIRKSVKDDELIYFITDENGQNIFELAPEKKEGSWKSSYEKVLHGGNSIRHGIVCTKLDEKTGFTIGTFVPGSVTGRIVRKILFPMILIGIIGYSLIILFIVILSEKMTKPIEKISSTMSGFDNDQLDRTLNIHSNTELDYIGNSYNKMLDTIRKLLANVKYKEEELKKSEVEMMLYQIQPHLLYNVLDTIYMLARIEKQETIMRIVQALAQYLRITLSNGNEKVTVEKEIQHIEAYMDIQKIRNADLFEYEVNVQDELLSTEVSKMILQPVVENSIKYGFRDIYDGGKLKISISEHKDAIRFEVENNGTPIGEEELEKVNQLEKLTLEQIDEIVKNKEGGFGISNVIRRLKLLYEDQVRFYYERKEEGTSCIIEIKKELL